MVQCELLGIVKFSVKVLVNTDTEFGYHGA